MHNVFAVFFNTFHRVKQGKVDCFIGYTKPAIAFFGRKIVLKLNQIALLKIVIQHDKLIVFARTLGANVIAVYGYYLYRTAA